MNMLNSYQSKSYLKLFLVFCFIFDISIYHSQTLTEFEQREIDKIFRDSKKLKESGSLIILNLIPSPSYNFNSDSWNLSFNLSNLTTFFQRKKRNKIEIARYQQLAFQELGQKIDSFKLMFPKNVCQIKDSTFLTAYQRNLRYRRITRRNKFR